MANKLDKLVTDVGGVTYLVSTHGHRLCYAPCTYYPDTGRVQFNPTERTELILPEPIPSLAKNEENIRKLIEVNNQIELMPQMRYHAHNN